MRRGVERAARMPRALLLAPLVAALVGACGGAAKNESGAASPSPPAGYAPTEPATLTPRPPSPASANGGSAPSGEAGASYREGAGKAGGDLETAQRELDVAAGDCVAACRALGAMDRATGRLCGVAQQTDERGRCEDAKARVLRARDKVRTTCGSCPGGVTVDRNAPVPNTSGRP